MPTILTVTPSGPDTFNISYPTNHEKAENIEGWLKHLSPGYTEYLLQFSHDPHCNACRDTECENIGMGDDACPGFKFGLEW